MMNVLAQLALSCGGLSLLCLLALHFTSPEFGPSWRMVSEYALGRFNWLLTAFFLLWAASSILLAAVLWGEITGPWARLGVVLLLVSAFGEIMGGLFDLRHRLHGMAFAVGVPSFPIAALLIGHNLAAQAPWSAHADLIIAMSHAAWVSVVLMGLAMAVMMAGFRKAGIAMGPDAKPPERVPEGVIALGGYANRLLVACDIGWLLLIAALYLLLR
jgi:hypothetical protein